MRLVRLGASVIVLGIAAGSTIRAATIYTSAADFAAATVNPIGVGFNGILAPGQTFAGFNPLTVAGIQFSTPNANTLVNVTTANFYSPTDYPADFIIDSANPGPNNELDVVFNLPILAFGLDYGAFTGGTSGTFNLSDGTVYADSSLPSLGSTTFVGFVSSTPISSFSFTAANDSWVVQDLVLATPAPEPGSGLLILAGFAGIWIAKRRLRRTGAVT
jgi:hypothetical protein